MKIALGCDHGGYELKQFIMKTLEKLGYEYEDFGCYSLETVSYTHLTLPTNGELRLSRLRRCRCPCRG